jgi:hypothetical protein
MRGGGGGLSPALGAGRQPCVDTLPKWDKPRPATILGRRRDYEIETMRQLPEYDHRARELHTRRTVAVKRSAAAIRVVLAPVAVRLAP